MNDLFVCLFFSPFFYFSSLHFYSKPSCIVYRAYNMPQLPEINEITLYLSSKTVKLYV